MYWWNIHNMVTELLQLPLDSYQSNLNMPSFKGYRGINFYNVFSSYIHSLWFSFLLESFMAGFKLGLGLWCLMPLSTIFQLIHGDFNIGVLVYVLFLLLKKWLMTTIIGPSLSLDSQKKKSIWMIIFLCSLKIQDGRHRWTVENTLQDKHKLASGFVCFTLSFKICKLYGLYYCT